MTIETLVKRARSDTNDEQYWIDLENDMIQFMKEDHPDSEKKLLAPIGLLEYVSMITSGMEYEKNKGK